MTDARPMDASALAGRRILAVEDESLVAMFLEDLLVEFGCTVIGPASRVHDALALVESNFLDGAVLDINLAGERVFPVADRLAELKIPFLFATGYGEAGLPDVYRSKVVLQKPYSAQTLRKALEQCFSSMRG